jgi:glycosyltransferase involved in cell wall biosynthesis
MNTRKIVLMFAEVLQSLGGREQSSIGLARFFSSRHNVDLIYGEDGDLSPQWAPICRRQLKLRSLRLRRRNPIEAALQIGRSLVFCLRRAPDVIYCQSMHDLPLGRTLSVVLRRPLVLHLRSKPPLASRRHIKQINRVARAIGVSESAAAEWSAAFPRLADRTAVIPNGIDLERFRPVSPEEKLIRRQKLELEENVFLIVYAGRFAPEKGPLDLIEAVRGLEVDATFQLLLVGGTRPRHPDYGARVMNAASGNVKVLPAQSDVEFVLQAADLVVVPSHLETFGRIVVEAIACGVPVVAGRVGGIPEILGGLPELLFTPGDIQELRAKLAQLIRERDVWCSDERIAQLRSIALSYGESAMADRVDAVLMRAASEGGSQREAARRI